MVQTSEELFTFEEVARALRVSAQSVRRWHSLGYLKAIRFTPRGHFRVHRSEVERLKVKGCDDA